MFRGLVAGVLLVLALAVPTRPHPVATRIAASVAADSSFARLVGRLSEAGGYFDTDNLISNESSYLHVLGKMRAMSVTGGAYIGVGPDQNFSYIAQVRPRIAFIIDLRRDNLLQQLFFKSLFALSRNRAEYLCLMFGRAVPVDVRQWDGRPIEQLIAYIDRAPSQPAAAAKVRASVQASVRTSGVPLSDKDLETIGRIHGSFIADGLDLRFTSTGRAPRPYYPTYRQLTLEHDLTGRQASYLASEEAFRIVKSLEDRDLIVPVVGNLAGPHALKEIGRVIAERGEHVSAFYTSNVEFYLMGDGSFDRFAENVTALPRDRKSVIIRSYFGGAAHPQAVSGYYSVQLLETIDSLVADQAAGGIRSYSDLVNKHALDLR